MPSSATPSPRWRSNPRLCEPAYSSISDPWCPSVRLAGDDGLHLDVEIGREDLRRSRCCGGAAVPAVLDHGADDELRVVRRPVPAPPRLILEAGVARQRDDLLGRSRLAGDRDREAPEDRVRRPEGEVRCLPEPLPDDL